MNIKIGVAKRQIKAGESITIEVNGKKVTCEEIDFTKKGRQFLFDKIIQFLKK